MQFLRSAAVQFALWFVASALTMAFIVGRYHYGERVETTIIEHHQIDSLDHMWFNRGAVLGAAKTDHGIKVFPVTADTSESEPRPMSLPGSMFAVSPEGDMIATASQSTITVTPLTGAKPYRHDVGRKGDLQAIAWMDGSVLIALHSSGLIQALDATSMAQRAEVTTEIDHPEVLRSAGTLFAIAGGIRNEIEIYDIRMLPVISLLAKKHVPVFTELALSSQGRYGLATKDGPVLDGELLPGGGPVSAVAFADDSQIISAGPSGTFLFGGRPLPVPKLPNTVSALVVNDARLAAFGAGEATVVDFRLTPPIREGGWSVIWRWLGATALIGILLFIRSLFTHEQELAEDHSEALADSNVK